MAPTVRVGCSAAEDAAYAVLAELGFPLPLDVGAVREYLGLDLERDGGLPPAIRGVLDVRARVIVIQEGLGRAAEEHVVLHEGGHYHLPRHRALLYRCSAFDLNPSERRRLEAEANTFATVLRFGGVPDGWVDAAPPSIARVSALADMTGASFEAALRWLVQRNRRPVWALVCDAAGGGGRRARDTVSVRYGYRSTVAPPVPWPTEVSAQWSGWSTARATTGWPEALAVYQAVGATGWGAYATAYWTCVLLW